MILNTTMLKEGFRGVMKDLATSPEDSKLSVDFQLFGLWLRWVIDIIVNQNWCGLEVPVAMRLSKFG